MAPRTGPATRRDTPVWRYEAVDVDGKRRKGTLEAASRDDALRSLQDLGLSVYALTATTGKGTDLASVDVGLLLSGTTDQRQVKLKIAAKADLARRLHQLLRAGLPVAAALRALADSSPKRQQPVLNAVHEQVRAGTPLAQAMAAWPRAFDRVFVAYIETAEQTGSLVEGTARLADMLERRASLERKIKAVTMYPKLVSGVIGALVVGILLFIVPMFAGIYGTFGADLPAPTKALQAFASLLMPVSTSPPFINLLSPLIWVPAGIVAFRWYLNRNRDNRPFAERWNRLRFKLPIFGRLSRFLALYRWASTLAGAQGAGVRLEPGLRLAGEASGSDWMRFVSNDAADAVASGQPLSRILAEHPDLFPAQFVALIETGERSGDLEGMLRNTATSLGEDIDMVIATLSAKVEVALLMIMAVVVGGLLIILYLPILNLMNAVMGDINN